MSFVLAIKKGHHRWPFLLPLTHSDFLFVAGFPLALMQLLCFGVAGRGCREFGIDFQILKNYYRPSDS
jgi:hypothetical protein